MNKRIEAQKIDPSTLDEEDIRAIEVALNQEVRAFRFYAKAADMLGNPSGRAAFEYFRQEERGHVEVLEAVRGPSDRVEKEDLAYGFMDAGSGAMEAVQWAMKEELNSQSMYRRLESRCAHPGLKDLFRRLASAEDHHFSVLHEMRRIIEAGRLDQFDYRTV